MFRLKFKSWAVVLGDLSQRDAELTEQFIGGQGYHHHKYPSVYKGYDPYDVGCVKQCIIALLTRSIGSAK